MREPFGRGMGAVGGGEGVVDIDVAERREGRDERRVVRFLARVKAGIFEDDNVAVGKRGNRVDSTRPNAVSGEGDRTTENAGEGGGNRAQRQPGVDPLRASEM